MKLNDIKPVFVDDDFFTKGLFLAIKKIGNEEIKFERERGREREMIISLAIYVCKMKFLLSCK